jgi:hypothetical protein
MSLYERKVILELMPSEKPNPKECKFYEGKIENDVCMVDQYPVATGEQVEVSAIHNMTEKCKIVHLRPEDFLKLVPETLYHQPYVERIKERIEKKQPLDAPWIGLSDESCGWAWKLPCITEHEGRHRAKAAQDLNLKTIPVILCRKI